MSRQRKLKSQGNIKNLNHMSEKILPESWFDGIHLPFLDCLIGPERDERFNNAFFVTAFSNNNTNGNCEISW